MITTGGTAADVEGVDLQGWLPGVVREAVRVLRRDRLAGSSADENRQLRLCQVMWWFRHLVVGAALVAGLGSGGWDRGTTMLAVLAGGQVLTHAWSRFWVPRAGWAAAVDGAVLLALTAAGLKPVVVLLVCVAVLGWAATFRPAAAIASYLEVLATVALLWRQEGDLRAGQVVVGFCLLGGIFMMRTTRLNIGARRAAEHERLVHEQLDAILWEQIPGQEAFVVSPAAVRVLGYPVVAFTRPGFWQQVVHPDDLQLSRGHLFAAERDVVTFRVRRADGRWRWMESRSAAVWDRRGRVSFAAGVLVDRTAELEAERDAARLAVELNTQARVDALTGLPNRRHLLETLRERLAPGDGPASRVCALFLIDLDDFKDINDSLGHHVGDQVLVSIGDRLQAAMPDGLVARLGGDEFAVLACGMDSLQAHDCGQRLTELVSQPLQVDGLLLQVRASIGIAAYPGDAGDGDELMRRADVAMYRAKAQGVSPQHYDSATDQFSRERVQLTAGLARAVPNGELVLHYQPLHAVDSGRLVSLEALARWQHPELGLLPPARFIELAEVSGQIRQITRWAIRQSLTDLKDLRSLGTGWADVEMSVNLSARNVYEPDFLHWLDDTLAELDVPGDRLVLEITEGAVMVDFPAAVAFVEALKDRGVRTWIDDFGTGHSSLARLRTLPVHGVKIDRSFVTPAADSPADQQLLSGVLGMIRAVGLTTIAEGVETAECLHLLAELDCDIAQGYHLGRPQPLVRRPDPPTFGGTRARVPAARTADRGASVLDPL